MYTGSVRQRFDSLDLSTTLSSHDLAKVLLRVQASLQADATIFRLLQPTHPSLFKQHLQTGYKDMLGRLYKQMAVANLVTFCNTYTQLCGVRDKVQATFNNTVPRIPYDQADLLDCLVAPFAEVHEERGQGFLKAMLQDEIGVFLQMLETYLEAYKLVPQPMEADKCELRLFALDSGTEMQVDPKRASSRASKSAAETASSKAENVVASKTTRASYAKIYPATNIEREIKSVPKRTTQSKTSFKTVALTYNFCVHPSLIREKGTIL